jgi:ribonuclease BN (tRNA processing enzyme)
MAGVYRVVMLRWALFSRHSESLSPKSESTSLDDESEFARQVGHSHITPVAQLAAEAGVGRLILIHLSSFRPEHGEPELDRAYPIFPRTEVAFDRMEIEF